MSGRTGVTGDGVTVVMGSQAASDSRAETPSAVRHVPPANLINYSEPAEEPMLWPDAVSRDFAAISVDLSSDSIV